MTELRQRPGDQPLPVPNDGPSMHDLVTEDLDRHYPQAFALDLVRDDLTARKALGLERYGSLLQAHNGRDALRDLYEELLDASVYARQKVAESLDGGLLNPGLNGVYQSILRHLLSVRSLLDAERIAAEGEPDDLP